MADYVDKEVNKKIKALEQDIANVYEEATDDLKAKLADYLSRFETKNKIMLKELANGEITKEYYKYWVTGQVLIGERWQEMVEDMSNDLTNAHKMALSFTGDHIKDVYALSHNYQTFQIEKDSLIDTSYTLFNRDAVERLIKDKPDLLPQPKVKVAKDKAWNKKNLNSAITQGILQGESIPQVQKRLENVCDMSARQAVRSARTAITNAQNAGSYQAIIRANEQGIHEDKQWIATLDGRTRQSHRDLDGVTIPYNQKFDNGLMYPGDSSGKPSEIYNCRCTLTGVLKDFAIDTSDLKLRNTNHLGNLTYEQWKEGKNPKKVQKKKTSKKAKK
jgi:SPP1 gp7 family putative phage head morphogenesis protein